MDQNIYNAIRPKRLSEMFPTSNSLKHVKELMETGKMGRSVFLYGESGCGKTTLARIIARFLNCESKDEKPCGVCAQCTNADMWSIIETNAADQRGIDDMRSLIDEVAVPPLNSEIKTVILDECHQLSKDAQNVILKVLEECPDHLCMIMCTTEPMKVLPTIRNRCYQIGFDSLAYSQSKEFMEYITKRMLDGGYIDEVRTMMEPTRDTIIGMARGSARQLTVLTYIFQRTGAVSEMHEEREILMRDFARVILGSCRWREMVDLIKGVKTDHEAVRIHMVNYFAAIAMRERKTKLQRCHELLMCMRAPLEMTNQKADFIARMLDIARICAAIQ